MKYKELSFYGFGFAVGVRNLFKNGFRLGLRNTVSAILQPVNSYTRFPEFFFMEQEVAAKAAGKERQAVLDIGSPKLLGLYMAHNYDADIRMTDISPLNIDPYERMWDAWKHNAKGKAFFQVQDARQLAFPDESYDIVYSMSVLEHIEGDDQDATVVKEMLRVLKPGGRLLISVPFGPRYEEQVIMGLAHAVERVDSNQAYFFQRIYDREHVEANIIRPSLESGGRTTAWTVYRWSCRALTLYHWLRARLPESVMTTLGFLNSLTSIVFNRHQPGILDGFTSAYGRTHSFGDIYSDLVLTIVKESS